MFVWLYFCCVKKIFCKGCIKASVEPFYLKNCFINGRQKNILALLNCSTIIVMFFNYFQLEEQM